MLAIFKKELVKPPQELNSPASSASSNKPKHPREILKDFVSSNPPNTFSISSENGALLSYVPPERLHPLQRSFCALNDIYCIFLGGLNNLCSLIKQYGLSKGTNEAMFVIEAYRTLRDRGPYPADQVLKGLDGNFAFVVYDSKFGTLFAAQGGANENVKMFWGIAADGSVVMSDKLNIVKASCAKSHAPFPNGCMFHSEQGLLSFEHPTKKMKAMPRIDSEGAMCGANFNVDVHSRVQRMPRVGSEANWTTWGSQA